MSPQRSQLAPDLDEETPFLQDGNVSRKETPLPITQITVLLLVQLTEPLASLAIRPYINQLVRELPVVGGDERKVGYYAGLILSVFFAAEAATVLQWNRLSDRVGRKPVLLCGILGTMVSSVLFGLSHSFSALIFSRCLNGMLSGNVGVMKSMMAELTDESNMARGFSLIAVTWAVGATVGPFIGGVLSRPQDRWPDVFSHPFWGENPYFLPCLATAAYTLLSFSLAAIFLEETVNSAPIMKPSTGVNSGPQMEAGDISEGPTKDTGPLPLRALLTRPVVISVMNYGMIALLEMTSATLLPLVWSTSVEFGGLSMSPASIGLWMGGFGFVICIFQLVAFPPMVRRFGPQGVFIASVIFYFPVFSLFPVENLALRHSSRSINMVTALFIILQLLSMSVSTMGFGSIFMYISSAVPSKRSLGAMNGIAQTVVSLQRAIAPAAAASLFAFSLDNNVLGGNFAYAVLIVIVCIGLCAALQLPRSTWKHNQQSYEIVLLD